jgi:hypothetical protein
VPQPGIGKTGGRAHARTPGGAGLRCIGPRCSLPPLSLPSRAGCSRRRHAWPATRLTPRAAYPHQPAAKDPGERGPGLILKRARAPSAAHRERATTLAGQSRVCRRVMPGRGRAASTTGAGPVCNTNRVPGGDCQDGLWGQVAVWPPSLVRVAWEPAAPVHCPPWWPRAPTTCYGTRGAASHLTVFCNTSPRCRRCGTGPGTNGARVGALILPKT